MSSHKLPRPVTDIANVASPGGHYSHAVIANGMLFVSGQLPISATGEKLSGVPFDHQVQQTLENVSTILKAGGAELRDLVQIRVYLDDVANWPRFNELYAQWIGSWKPARAVVPISALHYGFKVEIEAVALLPTTKAT
jgi:reactive intermediate/imine deaminase